MSLSPWVTAREIATDFGIGLTTARAWMLEMHHFRHGRVVRVSRSAYEAWKDAKQCRQES